MPNLLAHYLVAKRFYDEERENPVHSVHAFLLNRESLACLLYGTQGPDPLFYGGLFPSHGLHLFLAAKKFGNRLHKTDGRRFFKALTSQAFIITDDARRHQLQSFIFGQFAHYLLDREAHPYIMYESGFDKDGHISGKYHYQHAYFESNIDVALASKFRMNRFLEAPSTLLTYRDLTLDTVDGLMLEATAKALGSKPLPKGYYASAFKNFKGYIKFSNTHRSFKKALLPKRIQGLVMPTADKLAYPECLNELRKPWKDPVSGKVRYDSYHDITDRVIGILKNCYSDILVKGFTYETIRPYLNGMDYYGVKHGEKKKHNRENSPL